MDLTGSTTINQMKNEPTQRDAASLELNAINSKNLLQPQEESDRIKRRKRLETAHLSDSDGSGYHKSKRRKDGMHISSSDAYSAEEILPESHGATDDVQSIKASSTSSTSLLEIDSSNRESDAPLLFDAAASVPGGLDTTAATSADVVDEREKTEAIMEVTEEKWKTYVSPLTDASFLTDEEGEGDAEEAAGVDSSTYEDIVEAGRGKLLSDDLVEVDRSESGQTQNTESKENAAILRDSTVLPLRVQEVYKEEADNSVFEKSSSDKSPIFTENGEDESSDSSNAELLTPDHLLAFHEVNDEVVPIHTDSEASKIREKDENFIKTTPSKNGRMDEEAQIEPSSVVVGMKGEGSKQLASSEAKQEDESNVAKGGSLKNHNSLLDGCLRVELFRKLNKISEGTYGAVYRAQNKQTGELVALKQIKYHKSLWEEGFPITSLREISILLELNHMNIVLVKEVVVGQSPLNVFMVMEYVEHELKTLLEENKPEFSVSERKCLLLQLLHAVNYLHKNWVLHRDLKTSNLLYNNKGVLKLCDFGMARKFGDPIKPYTHNVVTLWYRAPELLLGQKRYTQAVDMWSVGCIFAEMILKKPLFPGHGEEDQLKRIFKLCGTPNDSLWEGFSELPGIKNGRFKLGNYTPSWRETFPVFQSHYSSASGSLSETGLDLLQSLLEMCPEKRISTADALRHPYFQEKPAPQPTGMMPTVPDTNSQVRKKKPRDKSLENDERKQQEAFHDASFRFGERVNAEMFLSQLEKLSQQKVKHNKSESNHSTKPKT